MNDKNNLALAYLTHSIKYLELSEKVFELMVKQGNKHIVIGSGSGEDRHDFWAHYHEQTKWSDFNIIFPALFLFYHGIELMIKGLSFLLGSGITHSHKDLLTRIKSLIGVRVEFITIFDKYLDFEMLKKTPLGDWLRANDLDIDSLYERLRYPTDKSHSRLTNNYPLKYQEDKLIPFVEQLIKDSKRLRTLSVSQLNEIHPIEHR